MPTKFKKIISGKYFPKIFLLLYTLFMCFAAYETNSAICLISNRTHLYGAVYIIFGIIIILTVIEEKLKLKWKHRIYKKAIAFSSCFFIYYMLTLVTWEIISLIFSIAGTMKAIGVIASVVLSVLIVIYGYMRTKKIKIKPYNISLENGDSDYRIALISDIHLGAFVNEKHISKMVDKINALNADIVVIAGDIFNGDNLLFDDSTHLKEISKQLCKIKAKEGVYAVVGNHDPKTNTKPFKYFMKASEIKLLNNDIKALSKINLIGRTDNTHNIRTELADILPKADPKMPIVVLDHKPENISDSAKQEVDLILCGHTHKGQLFPVTLFTRLASGKDCFYGYHKNGKTHSIITSGVGFFELPMRLGSSNEIVDIHIKL